MTAKSEPARPRTSWNGDSSACFVFALSVPTASNICPGPSKIRKIDSGFRKISRGPMNPLIDLRTDMIATSVEIAALAPFESESCFPARIARNGM